MPFLQDGTPVDIVLNPLGVPSRMNVGQILETHLGWAARVLGQQLDWMVKEDGYTADNLRDQLKKIFSSDTGKQLVEEMSDKAIIKLASEQKEGVLYATPVFDGASESEIRKVLETAGLPVSGQTVLFDGRTGEAFDQDVTVGVFTGHPAAPWRQGAVRWTAARGDGGLGHGSLRRGIRVARISHGQERRRHGSYKNV